MQNIKSRATFFFSLIALYFACVLALDLVLGLFFNLLHFPAKHGGSGVLSFIIGFLSNGKVARTALSTGKHVIAILVFSVIGTSLYILAIWVGNTPPSEFSAANNGWILLVDVFVAYTTYAVLLAVTVKDPQETDHPGAGESEH